MNHYRLNKLFAACQAVIPSRPFISTLSLSAVLTLQLGLVCPTFAADATTTTTTDPTTTTTDPTTVVDEQALLNSTQSLLSMSMENDADGLLIRITGLSPSQIDKIFFDGADVSELVNNLITQGIATLEQTDNTYSLHVSLPSPIEGEHTLAISTSEGSLLSKKVKLEKYSTDKGTLYSDLTLKGTAYYKGKDWWFKHKLESKTITVSYKRVTSKSTKTYTTSIQTDGSGKFEVSCRNFKNVDIDMCIASNRVSFSYKEGVKTYRSPEHVINGVSVDPIMLEQ
ncbi:MAG: hypothetical protein RJA13_694 [Bacteroidota bacterium]|jgi:hypothetical protein